MLPSVLFSSSFIMATAILKATCPPGMKPGQQFIAQAPNGQQVVATIPYKYPDPIPPNTPLWISYVPVSAPMPIVMSDQDDAGPPAGREEGLEAKRAGSGGQGRIQSNGSEVG